MAINERLVHTASAAAAGTGNQAEGLILHLDANDVDSYDGDGDVWYDINGHEYTPSTNVSKHFNTVIYTGTGTTNAITGVGFEPDLIWVKNRDQSDSHAIVDSVRGITSPAPYIASDRTDAQFTSTNMPTSVQSDGFTITGNGGRTNTSGEDYVVWCFNAGGAPTATNTGGQTPTSGSKMVDGTAVTDNYPTAGIYPTKQSVNTKLGFSITKYTGAGSGKSLPHGLDVPPEMYIIKTTSTSNNWWVYTVHGGDFQYLKLNGADSGTDADQYYDRPTANVIEQGQTLNTTNIMYSFASKRGVSKVGSYTGTGASGNKVYTGFEPAFLMIKGTDQTSDWIILDNKRDASNPNSARLDANSNGTEYTGENLVDFNRDGFTLVTNSASKNGNNKNFIYYAIAKDTNETELVDGLGFKPSIDPEAHFNTVTWTGDGASTRSITGVGFEPDLVWIKKRNSSSNSDHMLFDAVRGVDKVIITNSTQAQYDGGGTGYQTYFNADGFSITGNSFVNQSSNTFVAWCFNAGGNEVTNTYGAINSTVRVNNNLGFSITKYTATGVTATVGHGLDAAPDMIIAKTTNQAYNWMVYHKDLGASNYLMLNSTNTSASSSTFMNNTNPTSSVFTAGAGQNLNYASGNQIITYNFTSKRGVSKVGSYEGTGTSGNKIFTEFEPAFVMVKNIDDSGGWLMYDNVRDADGVINKFLYANLNNAESNASTATITPNKDGFTIGNSNSVHLNRSGDTFIYLAFAKNTNNEQSHLKLNLEADSYSGSGDWLDSSGNGNNGTISGATFDSELGNWLDFDGSNDYVLPSHTPYQSSGALTMAGWINPDIVTQLQGVFSLRGGSSNSVKFLLSVNSDNALRLDSASTSGFITIASGNTNHKLSANKWHHIAATIDYTSKQFALYLDGNLVSSGTNSSIRSASTFNVDKFYIGANYAIQFFNGQIGQARVYSTALTQAEIKQNFNFTKPKYPNGINFTNAGGRANWLSEGSWNFDASANEYFTHTTGAFKGRLNSNPFAFSVWLWTDTVASGFASIIEQRGYSDSSNNGFGIYRSGSSLEMYGRAAETQARQLVSVSSVFTASTWVHIVVQRTGTTWEVYVNGSSATNSGSYKDNATYQTDDLGNNDATDSTLIIGRQWQVNTQQWDGKMSDIKFFDKALNSAEITAEYNKGQFGIG